MNAAVLILPNETNNLVYGNMDSPVPEDQTLAPEVGISKYV